MFTKQQIQEEYIRWLKYAVEDKDLIEELKEMQEDGAKQEDPSGYVAKIPLPG